MKGCPFRVILFLFLFLLYFLLLRYARMFLVLQENRKFAEITRIIIERKQYVISKGENIMLFNIIVIMAIVATYMALGNGNNVEQ